MKQAWQHLYPLHSQEKSIDLTNDAFCGSTRGIDYYHAFFEDILKQFIELD